MGQRGRNSLQVDKSQQKKKILLAHDGRGNHMLALIKITASQVTDTFPLSW